MADKKFDAETLASAINEANGVISEAARLLGCTPKTIYNYRDEFEEVAQAIEDARDNYDCDTGDLAESKLRALIEEGNWPAIKFALSTKFKSRGYTEKTEIEHTGVQTINVNFGPKPTKVESE